MFVDTQLGTEGGVGIFILWEASAIIVHDVVEINAKQSAFLKRSDNVTHVDVHASVDVLSYKFGHCACILRQLHRLEPK